MLLMTFVQFQGGSQEFWHSKWMDSIYKERGMQGEMDGIYDIMNEYDEFYKTMLKLALHPHIQTTWISRMSNYVVFDTR